MSHTETILRFQVQRHEELPEAHQAALRERGIDPAERWSLIYSCPTMEAAEETLAMCNEEKSDYETYRIVDAGKTQHIEVGDWF